LNNEKGFIFPLTLILVSLSITILLSAVQIYLAEKRFSSETQGYYHENSMVILTLRKQIQEVESSQNTSKGMVSFGQDSVDYSTQQEGGDVYRFSLEIHYGMDNEIFTEVLYNKKQKRLYNWVVK
jgi:hypothetical protein